MTRKLIRECAKNRQGSVEGNLAKHNQCVCKEEKESFLKFQPIPKLKANLGPLVYDPGPPSQGKRVNNPKIQSRNRNRYQGIGKGKTEQELMSNRPDTISSYSNRLIMAVGAYQRNNRTGNAQTNIRPVYVANAALLTMCQPQAVAPRSTSCPVSL